MLAFFWPEGMGGLTYAEAAYDVRKGQGTMRPRLRSQRWLTSPPAPFSDSEWAGMCRALEREDPYRRRTLRDSAGQGPHGEPAQADHGGRDRQVAARGNPRAAGRERRAERAAAPAHGTDGARADRRQRLHSTARPTTAFGEVHRPCPRLTSARRRSRIAGPAPRLGEHGPAILADLGYDDARRDALFRSGAVVDPGRA